MCFCSRFLPNGAARQSRSRAKRSKGKATAKQSKSKGKGKAKQRNKTVTCASFKQRHSKGEAKANKANNNAKRRTAKQSNDKQRKRTKPPHWDCAGSILKFETDLSLIFDISSISRCLRPTPPPRLRAATIHGNGIQHWQSTSQKKSALSPRGRWSSVACL